MNELLKRMYSHIDTTFVCHMCRLAGLELILDLGFHPPSDAFLDETSLLKPENTYPLRFVRCPHCGLFQIDHKVDPKILYQSDYPYESSTTKTGTGHYLNMAKEICEKFQVRHGSLCVDIGSNVGVLLQGFKDCNMNVLGVDPAPNMAEKANKKGIPTFVSFFDTKTAKEIISIHGKAFIITGTNVFAHLHAIDDAVNGMKVLLDDKGVIVIEAPYGVDLIENLEYDTIYHEHIAYLTVKPMISYFERQGLDLFDIEKHNIHGGTLRYFVCHRGAHSINKKALREYVELEDAKGLYSVYGLSNFAKSVMNQKIELLSLLTTLKKQGKRIVGISAPAKGNTLLNYCGIDCDLLDYISEKAQIKVGKVTPGTHIPIVSDQRLLKDKPDYGLILAWNFSEEIMSNMAEFKKTGGQFIIPVPHPMIV